MSNGTGHQLYLKCQNEAIPEHFFEHNGHKRKAFCSPKCRLADFRRKQKQQADLDLLKDGTAKIEV